MRPEDANFQVPLPHAQGHGMGGSKRAEIRPRGRASKTNRGTTLAPDAALPKPGLNSGAADTHLEALPLLPLPSDLLVRRRSLSPGCCHWTGWFHRLHADSPWCGMIGQWSNRRRRDAEICFL